MLQEEEEKIKEALFHSSSPSPTKQLEPPNSTTKQGLTSLNSPSKEEFTTTSSINSPTKPEITTTITLSSNASRSLTQEEEDIEQTVEVVVAKLTTISDQEQVDEEEEEAAAAVVETRETSETSSVVTSTVAKTSPTSEEACLSVETSYQAESGTVPRDVDNQPVEEEDDDDREEVEENTVLTVGVKQMEIRLERLDREKYELAVEKKVEDDEHMDGVEEEETEPIQNCNTSMTVACQTIKSSVEAKNEALGRLLDLSAGDLAALGRDELVAAVGSVSGEQSRLAERQSLLAEFMTRLCTALTNL